MSIATFNEKRVTVNKWILDYTVFVVWNDYIEHGSVDYNCNRELIQWIISQESDMVPQIYILYLLCRLNDGENYMNQYSNDSTLTVLEDAADILELFLTKIKQTFRKEGENLLKALREEAVYVCCRDNNFDKAREVYSRQFPSNSEKAESKENINRDIQKLLKSKNPEECSAENLYKYEDFLLKAKKFLKHFISSEEPYLLQMTEKNSTPTNRTRRTTDTSNGDYSDKRVNLATFMKVCEEMGVSKKKSWPNFMEQRALKEHLQKVNAEKKGKSNSNLNANTASSPEKKSSPRKRKLGQDEESAADKSLCTRVQDNANLNPHAILNFEIPKMATRGDKSSPSRIPASPVKLRNPWLEAEVDEFYCAVQVFGIGNWSRIRDEMETQRSNVQLKDKWRTILKCGEIERLKKKFGDVMK